MKAKKSYGQHFLKEESIARKIAESLENTAAYKNVLEVGPGQGMLTKYLLDKHQENLQVVEADRDMVSYLQEHYPELTPRILELDFLKLDTNEVFDGENFAVIGNFPYNISSQILIKVLDNKELVPEVVGMFQKEVAERIAAGPGSKTYGILSVLMQAFYDIKYLFSVKPGSFIPPPKVQSGVIRLERKKDFVSLGCDEHLFRTIVKVCFNRRRKMIRNSLKPFLPKDVLMNDTFFQQRSEQLTTQDFIFLTNQIDEYRNS